MTQARPWTFPLLICITAFSVGAQSGGGITIEKNVTASGGTSQAGGIVLESVFGQPVTGSASGGGLTFFGGFYFPQLVPTAAGVSVSGKVLTLNNDQGVRGSLVTISDLANFSRTVSTGTFGRFRFEGIIVGKTYLVSVQSRRYVFADQLITINDSIADLQFIGQPR